MPTHKQHLSEEIGLLSEDAAKFISEMADMLEEIRRTNPDLASHIKKEYPKVFKAHPQNILNGILRLNNLVNAMQDGPELTELLDRHPGLGI